MKIYRTVWSCEIDRDRLRYAYLTFAGRATRREYWEVTLLAIAVVFLGAIVCGVALGVDSGFFAFIGALIMLLGCLACIPVCVRRLHDRGMGWWWVLVFGALGLVPGINIVSGIAQFVIVGCLDGCPGPNRFGPDPKCRPSVSAISVTDSIDDRLAELERLRESGLISVDEYGNHRERVLSQI